MPESGYDLAHCVESILNAKFPQYHVLTQDGFMDSANRLGITVKEEDLNYFEATNLVVPLMIVRVPDHGTLLVSPSALQSYRQGGVLSLPGEKNSQDAVVESERIVKLYHQFQTLILADMMRGSRIEVKLATIQNRPMSDMIPQIERNVKFKRDWLLKVAKIWDKRLLLLLLLEEPYGPIARHSFHQDVYRSYTIEQWLEWRKSFSASELLKVLAMNQSEVIEFYTHLAFDASRIDPMAQWYVLQRIARRGRLAELSGPALLAQEYYSACRMVNLFLEDVGAKQLEPDDLVDGESGKWKDMFYSSPFNYELKSTRKAIIQHFLLDQYTRIAILVEGETEEQVVKMIFDVLGIDNERQGILLYNYGGIGNLKEPNVEGLFTLSREELIPIFIFADNEENSREKMQELEGAGKLQTGMYKIWNGDFEQANFGVDRVIESINALLAQHRRSVESSDVQSRISVGNRNLMLAISESYRAKYHSRLEFSKPDLAKALYSARQAEIKEQMNNEGTWQPVLPIEQALGSLFKLLPVFL